MRLRVRAEITSGFARPDVPQIWVARLSKIRGVAPSYIENLAIEGKPKMWCRWDAKSGSYSCANPKAN